MRYALLDDFRQEPTEGAKGQCEMCGAPALAKCGPKVTHHWAHAGRRNCDPWWGNGHTLPLNGTSFSRPGQRMAIS